jgi:hypothetical protein
MDTTSHRMYTIALRLSTFAKDTTAPGAEASRAVGKEERGYSVGMPFAS